MITDRSPDDVFQFRKSETTTKNKACDNGGVRERDHPAYMWKLCLQTRRVHAPSLAVRKSIVAVESRASEVHFTLDICDVPRPRPSSYLSLSCVSERCSLCTRSRGGVASWGRSDVGSDGDEMRCGLQVSSLSIRQASVQGRGQRS